ncbi:right-handed parallel beta-helix repeat-containing protein [Parasediminibacterium sp. JCM 36343]|uniref:right-handed parallel beta-helix repeat-containing protein n=1 Tax=Parasediminibacterium sp. JCM 36343 TaxID=3374279 RepID=UPI003979A27A
MKYITRLKKICLVVITLFLSSHIYAQTVNIYVSPTGSSSGNGTTAGTPVNLSRARDVAKANTTVPCVIWLQDGTYPQFSLDATDARAAAYPVTYKAVNPLMAIFQPVNTLNRSDFQPIPDSVKNRIVDTAAKTHVMQLDLTPYNLQNLTVWLSVFGVANLKVPSFYQDGVTLPLSRYPNDSTMSMNGVLYNGVNKPDSGGIFKYKNLRTKYWVKALADEGVWLAGNWRVPWVQDFIKTKSIDTLGMIITQKDYTTGGIGDKYNRPTGNYKEPYFVSNLFEEIDTVGEWSVNFNTKMLYMWVPSTGTIQYSSYGDLSAIVATDVTNTQFQNIKIVSGSSNGVQLNNCTNVTIAGFDISYCTNNGVYIKNGSNCTVKSSDIHLVGAGGVIIRDTAYTNDLKTLPAANHQVINNHIYSYATTIPLYSPAVDVRNSIGNYVAYNKIHDCPHVGIEFDNSNNNLLEYNEVYDVVKEYSDMGGFYATGNWQDRGNKLNHNYLHDSPNGNGLYLDNYTSGDSCNYNIVVNGVIGQYNHDGYFNRFFNNVLINCSKPVSSSFERDTIAAYITKFNNLKALYYSSATYRAAYPELADLLDTVAGTNKAFTSRLWSQTKGNVYMGFTGTTQVFNYVSDANLFNANGTTNNTYAQTSDPFVKWGMVFQNNLKVTNKLANPIVPFQMDSLRLSATLQLTGSTDWHINRIGLYADSFRTSVASTKVLGVDPKAIIKVTASSYVAPATLTLTTGVKSPNIANCISSIKFYDNGVEITGLTINKVSNSFDSVTYTTTYTGVVSGSHSITSTVFDAPNWSYAANTAQVRVTETRAPYPGPSAATVPGQIEAENYDKGGEGISYHDTTFGNTGGQYRFDDVDIQTCSEGGYNVGWLSTGE